MLRARVMPLRDVLEELGPAGCASCCSDGERELSPRARSTREHARCSRRHSALDATTLQASTALMPVSALGLKHARQAVADSARCFAFSPLILSSPVDWRTCPYTLVSISRGRS